MTSQQLLCFQLRHAGDEEVAKCRFRLMSDAKLWAEELVEDGVAGYR